MGEGYISSCCCCCCCCFFCCGCCCCCWFCCCCCGSYYCGCRCSNCYCPLFGIKNYNLSLPFRSANPARFKDKLFVSGSTFQSYCQSKKKNMTTPNFGLKFNDKFTVACRLLQVQPGLPRRTFEFQGQQRLLLLGMRQEMPLDGAQQVRRRRIRAQATQDFPAKLHFAI